MHEGVDSSQHQQRVDAHFDARADLWRDLYAGNDLWSVIHRQRREIALAWIDDLSLPAASRALEVGCGAGLLALDLARRGFTVDATDVSVAMVETTRAQVSDAGLQTQIAVSRGDVHALEFESESFTLVVALGVFPFLHTPHLALAEVHRVLRPGGHLLLTSDNRLRLNHLLDPSRWILLRGGEDQRRETGRGDVPVHYYSAQELDRLLAAAGFGTERSTVLGYGPVTFFGRSPLTEGMSIALHRRLQMWADRSSRPVQAIGAQHIVLARTLV